jgi:hypothetical protein
MLSHKTKHFLSLEFFELKIEEDLFLRKTLSQSSTVINAEFHF